ncbi:MAG TPA: amidohydrolase family protein, partial [Burkholderiales bacterium]|nr:amidohydrolase family protein [Burkholderiales bacterium]
AGLRIFIAGRTTAQDARLDDPRAFAAWEYAIAARVPICVQLRAGALGQLQSMLARFPKARVLLDHMARPVVDDAAPLVGMAKYENLYLKLTTHNVRELPQGFFARVVNSYGAARIAWGSNYPAAAGTLGALLADAREALTAFSAAERDWIFSRTAKSFYAALA